MTDLAIWKARAADPDPATAAEVWTDCAAPAAVLRHPPAAVLNHLLGDGAWNGTLYEVLRNPALPASVLAALADSAKGQARTRISRHARQNPLQVPRLVAAAGAITAAELGKTVDGLRGGGTRHQDAEQAQRTLTTLLRVFTTSANPRCRALAAQAFPLIVGPRHRYAEGAVSATKLAADPEITVLVALARNPHLRALPESEEGMAVRRALLDNPAPRVRAAARRSGVHVLTSHVIAVLSAANGHPLPVTTAAAGFVPADPLDDPAPSVRATAVVNGIHQQDGARWARVLADPSPQVRKAAATRGYRAPSFVQTALAEDPDPTVRAVVAGSSWVPAELQRRLLSDADPAVAAAAAAADPLARPVLVRPSLPADAHIMLPASNTHDPRIRSLDLAAVTLTVEQQRRLAAAMRTDTIARATARARVIACLGSSLAAQWVADRWDRWCVTFDVPAPAPSTISVEGRVAAPFAGAGVADDRVTGALALFDAVLGLAAAPLTAVIPAAAVLADLDAATGDHAPADPADLALLTGPWERLLPASVTEDTVYGPNTPEARDLLTAAARLPASRLDTLLTTRIGIDIQRWSTARAEAVDTLAGPHGQLYAPHFLFWDTVTVAELASWRGSADPLLADALWGAAAVALYGEQLSPTTVETLTTPCVAAGLAIP